MAHPTQRGRQVRSLKLAGSLGGSGSEGGPAAGLSDGSGLGVGRAGCGLVTSLSSPPDWSGVGPGA